MKQQSRFRHSITTRLGASILLPPLLLTVAGFLFFRSLERKTVLALAEGRLDHDRATNQALLQLKATRFAELVDRLASDHELVVLCGPASEPRLQACLERLRQRSRLDAIGLMDTSGTATAFAGSDPRLCQLDHASAIAQALARPPHVLFADGTDHSIFLIAIAPVEVSSGQAARVLFGAVKLVLDAPFYNAMLVSQNQVQSESVGASFIQPYIEEMQKSMRATQTFDHGCVVVSRLPITGSDRILGYLLVGIDQRKACADLNLTMLYGIVVSILILGLLAIYARLLARALTAPLLKLVGLAEAIASGQRDVQWLPERRDEIGSVSTALKRMTDELTNAVKGLKGEVEERSRMEIALRENELRYRTLFESGTSGVLLETLEGRVLDCNETACRMHGYTRDEMKTLTAGDLVSEETAAKLADVLEQQPESGSVQIEAVGKRNGGDTFPTEVSTRVVALGDEQLVVVHVRDITDRRQTEHERGKLQDQLRQTVKMHAMGQLAGGIAHDFNNLLTGIIGEANMLTLDADPGTAVHQSATTIERAASRAAELTQQLMGFARQDKQELITVDLHGVIEEVVEILARTISKSIEFALQLDAPTSSIEAEPAQLGQVILNLAINARDAMPDGGVLTLKTDVVQLDEQYCRAHGDIQTGPYLRLSVQDTGTGIPSEELDHIFEPFFTTKNRGKGTGLGLATVYDIVNSHGGAIDVESKPGAGTTFRVHFPLSRGGDTSVAKEPGPKDAKKHGHTILLVDDEEILRRVVSRMLGKLGLSVVTANNGREAVDYYRSHADEISLVVLDMVMPVMGGKKCFEELKRFDPNVKVLVSTGSVFDGKIQELLDDGVLAFVQKPYKMDELAKKVHETLGDASAAS